MDFEKRMIFGGFAVVALGLCWIFHAAHGDDVHLKAACEAQGGVFIEARQPMHVCVKPAGE